MPEEKKEKTPNTIFGYSAEELRDMLRKYAKKVPFFGSIAAALERSTDRIEGKRIRPEEK